MTLMKAVTFKYTFPIVKSEQRADGRYITGFASGPEIDSEGERMAPEAIERFAAQINETDGMPLADRLVYRDAHAPDGVLRDLGVITKAWVDPEFHLGIEVKLDEDNPASDFLWKQLNKGKQYGMSVSGRVLDYAYEKVAGLTKPIRTYKNVVLDEISNTTRPAWYPSFGSVLAKSIKDASIDAPAGVNVEDNELLDAAVEDTNKADEAQASADETTKSEETPAVESEGTEKSSDAANDAASASYIAAQIINLLGDEADEPADADVLRQALAFIQQYITQETAEIGTPEDQQEGDEMAMMSAPEETTEDDLDKAGRSISATNGKKLLALYNEMTSTLTDLGLLDGAEGSEKSDSGDEEDTLDKSGEATADDGLAALQAQVEALTKANAEQAARIEELEKAPRTQLPGVITDETKKSAEDSLAEVFSKASPSEKLRLAFALQTQGR